jgi:membrane protein DedA with SNARE-associated domain
MHILFQSIERYGISFVFANVLVEQLGVPLPGFMTLVVTGAMLDRGEYSTTVAQSARTFTYRPGAGSIGL